MPNRYIVFDVETPNFNNDRISAIGITVVEAGQIVERFYTLVDPEAHFDSFNIQLTGITPKMVEDAPNFRDLWQTIEPIMASGVLVAHNARFDLGVLCKCLRAYKISWKDSVPYACTCVMGRKFCPDFPNHKLNTMCEILGIDLNHHHAGSDSDACAEILLHYIHKSMPVGNYLQAYHF